MAARYPKRKRLEVQYTEESDGDQDASDSADQQDVSDFDEEATTQPPKKPSTSKRPRKQDDALPKEKVFPFLLLPGEIRNQIYRDCLVATGRNAEGELEEGLWLRQRERKDRKVVEHVRPVPSDWNQPSPWKLSFVANSWARGSLMGNQNLPRRVLMGSFKSWKRDMIRKSANGPLAVNLLRTCKQIYAEGSSILYGQRLIIHNAATFITFLTSLKNPLQVQLLQSLELREWAPHTGNAYPYICYLATKKVTNLRKFVVRTRIEASWNWRGCSCAQQRGSYGSFLAISSQPMVHIPNCRNRSDRGKSYAFNIATKIYRECHAWFEVCESQYHREWQEVKKESNGLPVEKRSVVDIIEPSQVCFGWHEDCVPDQNTFKELQEMVRTELRKMTDKMLQ
jgi:hypothetical protein